MYLEFHTCQTEDEEVACKTQVRTAFFEMAVALQVDNIYNTQLK
jgi:hypothetical protein